MMNEWSTVWPQIVAGGVVSLCSLIITGLVKSAAKKLENVATKDFVVTTLANTESRLKSDIAQMFLLSSQQQVTNADVEFRLRKVESLHGQERPRA